MEKLYIGGAWCAGSGEPLESFNPANGQRVWLGNAADVAEVSSAVAAARSALVAWRKTPLQQRCEVLTAFAQRLESDADAFAQLISKETGKPLWESKQEVTAMVNKVAISVAAYEERTGSRFESGSGLQHRALGVMAVFGPYNFPGHLPNGHITPALLAGNTVVFKPSEKTPAVAQRLVELFECAGVPAGVINLVQGGGEVGALLSEAGVNGILFTGSYQTGVKIHRQLAGRPEVLLALEMGGNNPMIVDAVENIEVAAWHVIRSAFLSSGQRCTCTRRLILAHGNAEPVLARVLEILPRLTLGHWQDNPFMGPLIDAQAAAKVLTLQTHLEALGAVPLLAAKQQPLGEAFVSPGVLEVVGHATLLDEEVFGPLLQVYRANDFEQALSMANDTCYGLAAGLLSDNAEHQAQFLQDINAGVVSVNQPTAGASSRLPFGGTGHSGNYRPGAYYAADYCAWPQAQSLGEPTAVQSVSLPVGVAPQ